MVLRPLPLILSHEGRGNKELDFRVKSISTKLVFLLVIAVLAPLFFYGLLSILTSRHYNFKAVTDGNINTAKRAAGEIDLYVTNSITILNALAQNLGRFHIPKEEQKLIVRNYTLNFPQFQQISLTDRAGMETLSTHNNLPRNRSGDIAYQTAVKGAVYKSEVFISRNLAPSMIIALPMKRLNRVEGVAIAEINLIAMWNLVDSIKIGRSGYAYVVSQEGRLIAHGLGEGKVRVLSGENIKSSEIVRGVLKGEYPAGIYKNIEGKKVIGVAVPIPSSGWGIVIEEPVSEAYAPARQMTLLLTALIILFVGAAVILGSAGGRIYIIQPLQSLIGMTRKIAGGDLDAKVAISTGDEFQEVGDAFNTMAARLKILQEEIKRNERIAFMSKIAASLVHDLRHPVKNIENAGGLIMKMYDREEARRTFHNILTREFSNINRFFDDLLNLSRPLQLIPVSLNVCAELRNIIEMFKEEAEEKGIVIKTIFSGEAIEVKGDKFSMERVFKNIIRNAIDVMPGGGTLGISVRSSPDSVDIEFRDSGPGIPADKVANLFTEFTTTKGSGLGLGLAISKRIIDAHNGTITIESEIGKGTTVLIRLPAKITTP